jgi:hypothetical protein
MQHRNTPDPDTGLSPAQVLFGRPVKDFMPIIPGKFRPQEGWRLVQEDREKALRLRYCRGKEKWSEHTKKLPKLSVGDRVLIQNQMGTPKVAKRWDRSGVVLEVEDYDKYKVRVDGSGRLTQRNRQFLRQVTPYQPLQPVHRAQVQTDPEEGVRQTGAKQVQDDNTVDWGTREDQEIEQRDMGDAAEMLEQPVETAGAVVEERAPVQEPRRSGRARKTNMKYNPEIWDLERD